ncbi:MAG: hypothetical protein A2504_07170 [Bdellovibrionales bacterium RIFOXYD12_FULL_39_22]|nr:MAG: hypothetical protein A2385_05385 [Bdellovibrionales bacterium RIFOXYB1_FULL_39_21]OFZ44353.1 MAG: hypothetical protein A2485_16165 [Bdellovibrionales bacterium RIFOXYC12_FULL_39_17]OFZ49208.1 MAG: hypothetical protein A2404_16105 [Bdellovibrionales bacterium RIFOXYC1_FULL_39_130]OFZ77016.1 MAG: hypothetical protein A2560_11190 [Bdellovibrionales bacterium RIFOXYD1_FULL_39_84]OFZ95229.1 MAG: hypothetical protein A2504_07170 [Bdellovibrionales bacterium RIFOXYD12_FULL_39_22]HLE09615.1 hy
MTASLPAFPETANSPNAAILSVDGLDLPYRFKYHPRSNIPWKKIADNYQEWIDFNQWSKEREQKDLNPQWRIFQRYLALHEVAGRIIGAVGDCRIYRDDGYFHPSFNSYVREGDDIITSAHSLLWIFLMDGTLVRLSPLTHLNLREINVGQQEILLHAKITRGNMLWLSRKQHLFPESKDRETDGLFLPLAFEEANPAWQESLENLNLEHSKKLNQLIIENNQIFRDKKSYSLIVLPTGYYWGEETQAEFIVLDGSNSYLKNRSAKFFNPGLGDLDSSEISSNLSTSSAQQQPSFTIFGDETFTTTPLKVDTWYQVAYDGTSISEENFDNDQRFHFSEFPTRRLNSIFVARELMLKKYSSPLFRPQISAKELAEEMGFKLWKKMFCNENENENDNDNDLCLRLRFLRNQIPLEEKMELLAWQKMRKKMLARGEDIATLQEFGPWAYGDSVGGFVQE